MPETKVENQNRLVIIAISEGLMIDLGYLDEIKKKAKVVFMTDTEAYANMDEVPTIRVSSMDNMIKYQQVADLYDCEPHLSIVIGTELDHIMTANHAGFRGICLHEMGMTKDAVCSPYSSSMRAGDKTTVSMALEKIWGPDKSMKQLSPERPIAFPPLHLRENGEPWVN